MQRKWSVCNNGFRHIAEILSFLYLGPFIHHLSRDNLDENGAAIRMRGGDRNNIMIALSLGWRKPFLTVPSCGYPWVIFDQFRRFTCRLMSAVLEKRS
jgi:hypothetical protein